MPGIEDDREDKWAQDLIVSDSMGLLQFSQWMIGQTSPSWVELSTDSNLKNCRNLQCIRHPNGDLGIWFRSSFDEVGYIVFSAKWSGTPAPTLFLPANNSICAEPLALGEYMGHGWQSVIIADDLGNLTHLQQASDTGHWRQKPFYIHHDDEVHKVDSYTINIRPLQEDQSPLISGLVQIRSSSAVTGYLNGRNVTLSPRAEWYKTDFEGTLNFIIPTESIACPTLTVTQLKSHTKTQICERPIIIDPSKKVLGRLDKKFEGIASWEDLKGLKTQSGRDMFQPNNMPHDDVLKESFKHLQTLRDAHKRLSPDCNTMSLNAADDSFIPPPESFFDDIAAAWHYITKAVHDVTEWAVQAAG